MPDNACYGAQYSVLAVVDANAPNEPLYPVFDPDGGALPVVLQPFDCP